MPRKKKENKLITYYIPIGSKEKIDAIVDASHFYKNKSLWKQKLYHLAEYISFQKLNNEFDAENEFVNVHQETMASILGTTNQQMATVLRDAIASELLIRDGIWKSAVTTRYGKVIKYIEEGKSFGYRFSDWSELNEVTIIDNRQISERIQKNTWEATGKYFPDLNLYHGVLKEINIDVEYLGCKILEVLINKLYRPEKSLHLKSVNYGKGKFVQRTKRTKRQVVQA